MTKPVIILTGGGSGGHITPIQAVAAEIKRQRPQSKIIYVGQTGDGLGDIPRHDPSIDECYTVRAGKFRRYHGEGLKQLLDLPTIYKNIRDAFYVVIGYFQSHRLLNGLKPDIIFVKGGFVGVPVGLAAARLKLPYITHDSDAIPGLANRIIGRWATLHAVALPTEVYTYDQSKTISTGIPLQADFRPVTEELKRTYRREIKIDEAKKLLFVIGGGLGALTINTAMTEILPHLLHEFTDLEVVHVVGRAHLDGISATYKSILGPKEQGRVMLFGYLPDVYRYSGAADIVITRAGATNLAEFAVQGKACIVIPSPYLTGGHQLKNAQYLKNRQAVVVVPETEVTDDANRLAKIISSLLKDPSKRRELENNFFEFAKPAATKELADVILSYAEHEKYRVENQS